MKKLFLASAAVACMLFTTNAQTAAVADPTKPQLIEKVTANPG